EAAARRLGVAGRPLAPGVREPGVAVERGKAGAARHREVEPDAPGGGAAVVHEAAGTLAPVHGPGQRHQILLALAAEDGGRTRGEEPTGVERRVQPVEA